MDRSSAPARVALLLLPVLALLSPDTDGPLGPLLALVALVAWGAAGWLLLVAALTCGSRVPGRLGRAAARTVRWVAPRSVRALVATAVGTSLLVSAPAAVAEDRTPTVAGSRADVLDWPGLSPVTAAPLPHPTPSTAPAARPSPALPPVHQVAAPARPAVRRWVVVAAGDSLWSLARRSLGGTATDRQVAQEWPRWWSANRALLGDAPDLIHPGDRLTAP